MSSLDIKLKHKDSDYFKEHFEEVQDLIKARRLSYKFDPSYNDGLYEPITIEKVHGNKGGHVSIILVELDYSKLFDKYNKSSRAYSKLAATIEFFKNPKPDTTVYEFLDNGFLEKVGIYGGDWRAPGFRWNDKEFFTSEGDDIIYDYCDQTDENHIVNRAYNLANNITNHLKYKNNNPNTPHKEKDQLQKFLKYLQPIVDPKTLEAYKEFKSLVD